MLNNILAYAKSISALVGSVVTALVATGTELPDWVPLILAVLTAVATYQIPNRPVVQADPAVAGGVQDTGA